MKYYHLNNGIKIPALEFGVWNLKPELCKSCLISAIQQDN
jgi:diketogulonate reductase-like aldo/keto reductase